MIDDGYAYTLDVPPDFANDARLLMSGDIALVKQSMRIMVQNASKYSPAGTQITLAAGCGAPGGGAVGEKRIADGEKRVVGEVWYSVQDEGVGMSGEDAAHVFERFWRSDEARSGAAEGTGLGLSIAKWIVDAHEGHIDVLSVEGVGTRFTVRFPALRA